MLINFKFLNFINNKDYKVSNKNVFSDASAKSYSRALYELASEEKNLDEVEKETKSLLNLFSSAQEFNTLIKDPTLKQQDQVKVINLITEKYNLKIVLRKFLNFLIIKRRFFFVEKILITFLKMCSKNRGEISASLIVAKKLNDDELESIKKDLSIKFGSNINLNYRHDPELIGGLIMQVESTMIDTSIKNKLQQIENKMVEA